LFVAAAIAAAAACGGIAPITYTVMPAALTPVDAEHNKTREFARVFCSTLSHLKDPGGKPWGTCDKYLETTEAGGQVPAALTTPYRFMLVPGFGSECLKDVKAFSTSIAHLKDAHQVSVEYFAVAPFGPSEENGKSIAKHVDEGWAADKTRKYVLVGYSKGTADLVEALHTLDAPKDKIAAIVTVAGVVGGSWLPDDFRALMQASQPWIAPGCPGNVSDGLHSLMREVRQASLRGTPMPVPGYSVVGISTFQDTSSLLRPTWKRLSVYAREQDGQVIGWEAVLPGAKYLGAARADHWAIALPFEESPHPHKSIDHNRFPRDALLEAIVRFVTSDLGAQ